MSELIIEKCKFFMSKVEYLGYVIDEKGLHPTEEKLQAIKQGPRPTSATELRAFLGIIWEIFANLLSQLALMHELLQKNFKWKWKSKIKQLFNLPRMHCKQIHFWFIMIVTNH